MFGGFSILLLFLLLGEAISFLGVPLPGNVLGMILLAAALALGAAAHGIGTARALEQGELEGASSGLAICLNGILTALLTPLLIQLLI